MKFTTSRLACLTSSLVTQRFARREFQHTFRPLKRGNWRYASALSLAVIFLLASVATRCNAQDMSTGSLNVTVTDSSGALIPGATLVLKDIGTNDVHTVTTKNDGTIVIPFLNPATYSLTVSKDGFATSRYGKVTITTNQVTNIAVAMKIGAATETVNVASDRSPILNTTTNTLATTLDMKQVQDLPTNGRDVSALAFLVPGAVDSDFNNLPGGAMTYSANGFSTESDRNKSGGAGTDTTQRLESTQEMTVQTGELDASKGGYSAMDIGFLTKRGTNQFHGELFEDYRSEDMNANSWANNFAHQKRGLLIENDFGASVGGPLLKDRLFFFASVGNFRQPLQSLVSTSVPTPLALSGTYIYYPCQNGTSGNSCQTNSSVTTTTNVLTTGGNAGCSTCTNQINSIVAADLANIEADRTAPGVTLTAAADPNHEIFNFLHHSTSIRRYPTLRLDYNVSKNFRLTGVYVGTYSYGEQTGTPAYSTPVFSSLATSSKGRNYQIVTGFDWTVKPNIVNAFRVGYLYSFNEYSSQGVGAPTPAMIAAGELIGGFGLTTGINGFTNLHGGSLYPTENIKDDTTWSHGKHTMSFGFEWTTDPDHYYNNQFVPEPYISGINSGDPVQAALDASVANGLNADKGDVEGLYATLTGRISSYSYGQFVNYKTKVFDPQISFDLDEKLTTAAIFFTDSWKATPTLTVNAGLRWNFTGASKDLTGFYTHPSISDLWGPSGQGNLFKPGTLSGNYNAIEAPNAFGYAQTYVHPQPSVGFAWNPRYSSDTFVGKMLGEGKSVIRGSFTLKNYTEGTQNFWNFGSNSGYNFNTYYTLTSQAPNGSTPPVGYYNAGSLSLGQALPPVASTSPIPYQSVITEQSLAFTGSSILTFDPHIKQPYVESWEFGIQRQLTTNQVIEVRYVGNVSKDGWFAKNYNEVNIFENGFLTDFKNAQANLAASGNKTFKGTNPTPIIDQAFSTSSQYTNATFITDLEQGAAGAFARSLAGSTTYLCALVGANFSPCQTKGIPGAGTYPINFWEANPFTTGGQISEMGNYASDNYNSLQIELRQNPTHGMQFDVNYTFSKSLGIGEQGSTAPGYYGGRSNSAPGFYTVRNPALNYFPTSFDVRQVMHASGTYDFPFGHGRQFLNQNAIANAVVGGWTVGTIVTWETGEPHLLTGGNDTFNQNDGGITLNGITAADLQHSIRPRHVAGKSFVQMLDPKFIQSNGQGANPTYITPNFTPGTIGQLVWLHAPANFNTDMSLTKLIPVYREINFKLQGDFFNVFNHVSWTGFTTGVTSTTFGTSSSLFASARSIELRANIQF